MALPYRLKMEQNAWHLLWEIFSFIKLCPQVGVLRAKRVHKIACGFFAPISLHVNVDIFMAPIASPFHSWKTAIHYLFLLAFHVLHGLSFSNTKFDDSYFC